MTYRDLFSHAQWKLDHNEITLGEYEEMTKPLNREVDVLDQIRAEIEQYQADCNLTNSNEIDCKFCDSITFDTIYRIIDKYRNEVGE